MNAAKPAPDSDLLEDWLPWLETLSPREIVLGLERVREVMDRLGLRRPRLVIHVGGTNGKGSSAAMLEAILMQDGVRTGCYTSPHVTFYNERIRIDGAPCSDEGIVAALKRVETARAGVPLTFFEFGTLAALLAFEAAGAQAWILEVGMGGRLDAVNAVEPDASLITNVSLDHCAWLGNDVESIAREKAGIMRAAKPAIFASQPVPLAILAHADAIGAHLLVATRHFSYSTDDTGHSWCWRGQRHELHGLRRPALAGDVQLGNAAAVLAVLEALGLEHLLTPQTISAALAGISLQGRFQRVEKSCPWYLDVAHNPGAALVLADQLEALQLDGRVTAIVGMMADKDVAGFIKPLQGHVDSWVTVTADSPRAASAAALAQQIANLCNKPCRIAEDIGDACEIASGWSQNCDAVLVTGSFYIVGPALAWLAGAAGH